MEIREFLDEVMTLKNRRIIDDVFLFIQNDRDLMKKYLYLVQDNDLQTVNQQIGKRVETEYGLSSCGENNEPESKLISTYSFLKKANRG